MDFLFSYSRWAKTKKFNNLLWWRGCEKMNHLIHGQQKCICSKKASTRGDLGGSILKRVHMTFDLVILLLGPYALGTLICAKGHHTQRVPYIFTYNSASLDLFKLSGSQGANQILVHSNGLFLALGKQEAPPPIPIWYDFPETLIHGNNKNVQHRVWCANILKGRERKDKFACSAFI